jgi:hypothetical protein
MKDVILVFALSVVGVLCALGFISMGNVIAEAIW